jgi:hypothetical protein
LPIEEAIGAFCEKPKDDKYAKLCYYIDPIKREVSQVSASCLSDHSNYIPLLELCYYAFAQPMKNGVPVDKICERLKKKSAEICALRFSSTTVPKAADVTDYTTLRIKDLKAIMLEKGISCPECLEKADYVAKLQAVAAAEKKEL